MGLDGGDLLRLGKKVIKGGAPIIGTLLGGSGGGKVGEIISSLFGGETDPKEIEALLDKDPVLYEKLKEFEMNHKLELEKLQFEKVKLELQEQTVFLQDVQSARAREIEVVKATGKKDIFMYVLAGTMFFGFMFLTGVVTYLIFTAKLTALDANMVLLLGSLYGTLSSGFIVVVGYFFGSSKGSNDKSELLANIKK